MLRLEVWNDATGTPEFGNYEVEVRGPRLKLYGRVERFDRSRGWAALLHEAIRAMEPK